MTSWSDCRQTTKSQEFPKFCFALSVEIRFNYFFSCTQADRGRVDRQTWEKLARDKTFSLNSSFVPFIFYNSLLGIFRHSYRSFGQVVVSTELGICKSLGEINLSRNRQIQANQFKANIFMQISKWPMRRELLGGSQDWKRLCVWRTTGTFMTPINPLPFI